MQNTSWLRAPQEGGRSRGQTQDERPNRLYNISKEAMMYDTRKRVLEWTLAQVEFAETMGERPNRIWKAGGEGIAFGVHSKRHGHWPQVTLSTTPPRPLSVCEPGRPARGFKFQQGISRAQTPASQFSCREPINKTQAPGSQLSVRNWSRHNYRLTFQHIDINH